MRSWSYGRHYHSRVHQVLHDSHALLALALAQVPHVYPDAQRLQACRGG